MVLAICARGGSGSGPMEGYRIVLATLGSRAGMGSGTPLLDLDLGTLGVAIEYSTAAPEGGGGGGGGDL